MRFTFPKYKDIPMSAEQLFLQLEHVREEVDEAIEALMHYGKDSYEFKMELLDISAANETNLRSFSDDELDECIALVVEKNDARGYYEMSMSESKFVI